MAKVGLSQLKDILKKDVGIIRFTRRIPLSTTNISRRMICTINQNLLNSVNGRISLNFRPPVKSLKYNPSAKNLLPVWDILMQDWRMVSMERCDLQERIKEEEFWEYFNESLRPMSMEDKIKFML